MPPSRRRTGNSAVKQATLSFGQKSRVSKASAISASSTKKEKAIESSANSISAEDSLDSLDEQVTTVAPPLKSEPHTAEVVIRTQANAGVEQPRAEEDVRALKVTEADLKRYWKNEERKTRVRGQFRGFFPLTRIIIVITGGLLAFSTYVHCPLIRVIVHRDGLDTYENILRHFDLSSQYGVRLCFLDTALFSTSANLFCSHVSAFQD